MITFEKLKSIISADKRVIILAVILLCILIILISNNDKEKQGENTLDTDEYISSVEARVENIVKTIDGAGECDVMIGLHSSGESIYVKENKKSSDSTADTNKSESEDCVITMSDSDGNEYALVRKELMPEISGVTVVCDGGDDKSVKNNVIIAVSTVLGIGSNKVCVIAKAN